MKSKNMLYLAMLATAAIWGGSFVVMKDSLEKQDVFSFLASRFILASILMFMYRPTALRGLSKRFVLRGIFAGILLGSGYIFHSFKYWFYYWSIPSFHTFNFFNNTS